MPTFPKENSDVLFDAFIRQEGELEGALTFELCSLGSNFDPTRNCHNPVFCINYPQSGPPWTVLPG